MDAAGPLVDLVRQAVGIGGLQLRQRAVVEDDARQFVAHVRQFDEHRLGGRTLALLGLLQRRHFELVVEDLLQLLGRAEVERFARDRVGRFLEVAHARREFAALLRKQAGVDQRAGTLDARQHGEQRSVDVVVDLAQPAGVVELGTQRRVQAGRKIGPRGCITRSGVDVDRVHRQALRALARDRLERRARISEVLARNVLQVVAARADAVDDVGLQHDVVVRAFEVHAVPGEDAHRGLQVVAGLGDRAVFEQRLRGGEEVRPVELPRHAHIVVADRHVGGLAGRHAERHADGATGHETLAGCLDRQRQRPRVARAFEPAGQRVAVRDHFDLDRLGRGLLRAAAQLLQPRLELEPFEEVTELVLVGGVHRQVVDSNVETDVAVDRRKLPGQRQLVHGRTQVVADLALHLPGVGDDLVQRAELGEPLGRGLRTHLRHARNVVHRVAHQGQVVDDLFGSHAVLGDHAVPVESGLRHRVDQGDVVGHKLGHVLVPRGNHGAPRGAGGLGGERADDVVSLHPGDSEQRHAHGLDDVEDRLDLHAQIVRHARPVRLVFREHFVAERRAAGVEDHGDRAALEVGGQFAQHADDPADCARGKAVQGAQVRQRMERPEKIGRAVDEQ